MGGESNISKLASAVQNVTAAAAASSVVNKSSPGGGPTATAEANH